jgi:hypothetical protein
MVSESIFLSPYEKVKSQDKVADKSNIPLPSRVQGRRIAFSNHALYLGSMQRYELREINRPISMKLLWIPFESGEANPSNYLREGSP